MIGTWTRYLLPLLLALTVCGCRSAADKQERTKKSEKAAVKPAAPAQSESPILARGYIFRLDRARGRDGLQCIIHVADMLRGTLANRQPVVIVNDPARSFPWIRDREYEGAEIFVHMTEKGGQVLVDGFSQSATGPRSRLQ